MAASLFGAVSSVHAQEQPVRTAELTPLAAEAVIAAEIPLSAEALALKETLEGAGATALLAFYEASGFAPIWDAPRKAALLDALGAVGAHGLPAARYDVDALSTLLSDAETPADMVELAAGRMFLKYA
ncbi:MAG: hypothetical protein AAFY59_18550, partial [Pseudomonadota bacterium]